MESRKTKVVQLVVAGVLMALFGTLVKLTQWNGFALVGTRALIGAIALWSVFAAGFGKNLLQVSYSQFKSFKTTALLLALVNITFVVSSSLTTVTNAVMLCFTAPVFALLINLLYGKWPSARESLTCFFGVVGLALLLAPDLELDWKSERYLGNIVGLLCGLSFGAYFVSSSNLPADTSKPQLVLFAQLFQLPLLISIGWVGFPQATYIVWSAVFGLGLLATVAFLLLTYGSANFPPVQANTILLIEPLAAPLIAFCILGEMPGRFVIAGAVLILIAQMIAIGSESD